MRLHPSASGTPAHSSRVARVRPGSAPCSSAACPRASASTAPSVPTPAPAVNSPERAAACREIGRWLRRATDGQHRGACGRDRLPQGSRYWVITRDFHGNLCSPVWVVRRFPVCWAAGSLQRVADSLSRRVCVAPVLLRMSVEEDDGEPLPLRDALASGEGFEDPSCPLVLLRCGVDEAGLEQTVKALVVAELDGRLVWCVPGSAWNKKVARRLVGPKRVVEQCLRGFGCSLPRGRPYSSCGRCSSQGLAWDLGPGLRGVTGGFRRTSLTVSFELLPSSSAALLCILFHLISFHPISFHPISFHFISSHFVSFHFISFHFISFRVISFHSFHFISSHLIVVYHILSGLISSYHSCRVGTSSSPQPAKAFFKLMEGQVQTQTRPSSALERALEGAGSGSAKVAKIPSSRSNAAARRALRDALHNSPSEISNVIESMMAEDLSFAAPGVGMPAQSSARSWAEYCSRIGPYPTAVWTSWSIAFESKLPGSSASPLNLACRTHDRPPNEYRRRQLDTRGGTGT